MTQELNRVVVKSKAYPSFNGFRGTVLDIDKSKIATVRLDGIEEGPDTFLFPTEELRPLRRKVAPVIGSLVRAVGFDRNGTDVDGQSGTVEVVDGSVIFVRTKNTGFHVKASQLRVLA